MYLLCPACSLHGASNASNNQLISLINHLNVVTTAGKPQKHTMAEVRDMNEMKTFSYYKINTRQQGQQVSKR